ncbi:hypothetical protein [Microbacter margulisiae]|uniref:Uncharacterized protein n=1 Tax=Microbacter margulisiae TaxID=1350067 RepID=A0A7W5DRP9_9PORP|nr:hypothetical protein [Microbacter margulisiae]MBB3187841.1 hypothetical protein [Microbacter margulisiae]
MSKETYTMPRVQNVRYDFANNVVKLCTENATAWDIPAETITSITAQLADYKQKYDVTSNRSIRNPAATAAREASWGKLEISLIDLYNYYLLYNDAITAADKEALHIHQANSGGYSPSPAPITTPVITINTEEISMLRFVYSDSSASGTHYKPRNVSFCEVWYKVDTPAPAIPDDCPNSCNISRSHNAILFSTQERGKTVYGFARWVNRNGKVGPWSGMFAAIVP